MAGDGDLTREVIAATNGWQIAELRTEEGRLDEVFHNITMPDTAAKKLTIMNSLGQHQDHRQARIAGVFHFAGGVCVHRHFPAAERLFHLHGGRLFRARPGLPGQLLFRLASLVLPVPGAGGGHALVGRGTARGHLGAAADHANRAVGSHRRASSSPPGCFWGWPWA